MSKDCNRGGGGGRVGNLLRRRYEDIPQVWLLINILLRYVITKIVFPNEV